ncbi:hypothetical protein HCU64_22135 [Methylobacterium sp. C25]|uniref:hypothetical protein n=1 Tax=Methylobacterium sp. C25 TaxID=2721622 RepID=UPI0022793965|nr:hypothetical protein [Methylobacterium sp. C25]MCE4226451.1 hypothetical protein [Methylobacterium sp. C25]
MSTHVINLPKSADVVPARGALPSVDAADISHASIRHRLFGVTIKLGDHFVQQITKLVRIRHRDLTDGTVGRTNRAARRRQLRQVRRDTGADTSFKLPSWRSLARKLTVPAGTAGVMIAAGLSGATNAQAQTIPKLANFADICTGLSVTLPSLTPTTGLLSGLLSPVTGVIDSNIINVLSGRNIGLGLLNANGTALTTPSSCGVSSSSGFALNNNVGISFGGGVITGLGGINNLAATANDVTSIAIGNNASTSVGAANAIAMGVAAKATSTGAVALGASALATGGKAVSIGVGNTANGDGAVAIGDPNTATGTGALAMGADNTATGTGAVGLGNTNTATGTGAVAIGNNSKATLDGTIALGNGASSTFANAVAIGTGTKAVGSATAQGVIDFRTAGNPNQQIVNAAAGTLTMTPSSVAIGENSVINTGGGVALGYNNNAGSTNGFFSTAIGADNLASGGYASAIGVNNTASGGSAVALGVNNTAGGTRAIAIGRQSLANADYSIAQGFVASAYGVDSIAIGKNSVAGVSGGAVTDDVAIGPNASATAGNSVALGSNSTATRAGLGGLTNEVFSQSIVTSTNGAVSVGAAGGERQITNVAGGTQATDAVNLRQLSSVANNVATTLGSTFDPTTGAYTAPSYTVRGTTYNKVGDAIAALDTSIGTATGAFVSNNAAGKAAASATGLNASAGGFGSTATGAASTVVGNSAVDNGIANSTVIGNGATVAAGSTGSNVALGQGSKVAGTALGTANATIGGTTYAFAGTAPAGTVSVGSAGAERTITNVAAGRLSTTSTDAVNGSQLNATNQQVTTNATNIATNTTNITNITNGTVGTVQRTGTADQLALVAVGGTSAAPGAAQVLTNVANGAVTAASKDAVNGSQLNTTNANVTAVVAQTTALGNAVATDLGGGSTYTAGGGLTAPAYNTFGTTATNVGAAITNLQTLSPVQYSNAAGTPAPQTRSNDIVLVGAAAGPVTMHNLAAGTANTDAVNVGQLNTAIGNGPFASNRPVGAANPVASGAGATAGGYGSSATAAASTAIGNNATDNGTANSTVLGNGASVAAGSTGSNVALGQGSTVAGAAVATPNATIGGTTYAFAGTVPAGTVSVGSAGAERTITNVAAGRLSTTSTDAVNGSQLNATNQQVTTNTNNITNITNGAAGTVQRTGTANQLALVAVGGTGAAPGAAQVLTNVANGAVTAASKQGVNGSQLFGTANSVATALGGTSTVNPDGSVAAPTYNVAGGSFNNVGSALTALDNGIANGKIGAFVADNTGGKAAAAASGQNASAGGFGAIAAGNASTVIGNSAVDNGVANSTVLGSGATVTAGLTGSNVALGQGSVVTTGAQANYTAFGLTPAQNAVGTVSVGSVGNERIVANVAAGKAGTDAVNVAQLTGAASNLGGSVASTIGGGSTYDATTGKLTGGFTVGTTTYANVASAISDTAANGGVIQRTGAANQVAITAPNATGAAPGAAQNLINVANGAVNAASTDAVNGSQLFGTAQSVATNLGGGSKVNADGTVSAPSYTVAGNTYGNVGDALAAGNKAAVQYTTDGLGNPTNAIDLTKGGTLAPVSMTGLANATTATGAVTLGQLPVQYTNAAGTPTPATPSNTVGLVGAVAGTPVTLGNVAAGVVNGASTQAVNGSQLFGTAQSVSTALGGGSTVNADGTIAAPSYNLANGTYNDVGAALAAIDNGKVGAFVADNTGGKAAAAASGQNASAGGFGAVAAGNGSTAIGNSAVDNGVANSTALGSGASITAGLTGSNVALGQGSVASTGAQANYVAFGLAPLQNAVGTVSVGSAGAERTLSNLAAGKADTDAVNVAQLSGAASNLGGSVATTLGGGSTYDATTGKVTGGFTVNGTTYTDVASAVSATAASGGIVQRTASPNQVALIAAGGSGTTPGAAQNLTNLAAGAVGAASTDAVNGSQLYGTAQSVSTALGGGSKVNADGSISAPTYKLATGSYNDVGSALTALDNGISSGKLGAFVADNTGGKAQASASGANASAGGFGAVASGAGSTSIGNSAVDNGVANSTVVGSGASITAGLTGSNVALGQGSVASTGARANYTAFGLAAPQNSVGTVSVGDVGAERTISNVAAGVAGTDAVNVAQLTGATQNLGGSIATSLGGGATYNATTGAITGPTYTVGGKAYNDVGSAIAAGNALGVQYTPDAAGNPTNAIDLTKGGTLAPVTVSGVGAGTLTATSTDAVNGSQLYATNQAVASIVGSKGGAFVSDNTSGAAIPAATGADSSVGGFGAVASGTRSLALGNGATSSGTNSVALGAGSTDGGLANVVSVGSAGNERRITNVAAGVNATDAANMGQLTALSARSLQYDTTATGDTNYQSVTLNPTGSGPVTIHNVAAGVALTDAVNVGQLNAASANSVQYSTNADGTRSNTLALLGGNAAAPVTISNVAAGVAANDAVNVGQLQSALNAQYNNLAQITEYQFRSAKMAAYAGTSIALATAGIRFDDRPGKISLGIGASGYHGSAGLAIGLGGTSEDGKWRLNVSAGFSPNNQKGAAGIMGGASYTFN